MSNKCQNEGVHVYINGNKDPAPIEITRTIKIDKPKPPPPPPGLKLWQVVLFIYVVVPEKPPQSKGSKGFKAARRV